uniref:EF-hand domain-containing protein n=1 Tax=Globisporangium ultimum (strain ATCC 200006 / CBS 805.95 / DAOM BR144) TaxID=431595 RepID=K3WVW6_GLOUD
MEKSSVRGLSLRGSMYALSKARSHRKKFPVKAMSKTTSSSLLPSDSDSMLPIKISSVDVLMKELRKMMHSLFSSLDPNIPTKNLYDNYSQQAFRYFTTTNTITSEAFYHRITKFGLRVSRSLCLELFGRIDQEDLGEIDYATFSRRVFLPPGHFNFASASQDPTNNTESNGCQSPVLESAKVQTQQPVTNPTQGVKIVRPPTSSRSAQPSSPPTSPWKQPPFKKSPQMRSPRVAKMPNGEKINVTAARSPRALNGDGIALIYEHMTLDEIENCISQKIEERTSRGTDRFRQAFRIFTKSEGITLAEFYHHLESLQIHLSAAKCRALFNRFDTDGNGTIELSEFTATIFSKQEKESELIQSTGRKSDGSHSDYSGCHRKGGTGHGIDIFEVEAGSTLSTDQILARLSEKLEQHTSKESDRFRQAYNIFGKSSGITPHEFNAAMGRLGLKLTNKQVHELFELFDFDKSGDLDLNEFVQGVLLDDCPTKLWTSVKDRQRLEESRKMLYSMAVQSVQNSWTIADIEQMLRAKIEQRTSRSSDCFRQAFRIFKKVNGIKPDEFHAALERIGLALDRGQSDVLFKRFDSNGSGDIDLDEFIHGVLPPDYTGQQWVAAADEMHQIAAQQKKLEALNRRDHYMTDIEMENWSLDEIERRIRDKIQQATSKSSDIFRQAYKIFKKSNHVTMEEFRERLLALGFRLTPAQCLGLFRRYDTNNSNDIDLQEFCMRILPPDYTGDGDYWSHSQNYHKHKQREKLDYVKRTKNGLLMLPKFDESRRYTRGQYNSKTFDDLQEETQSSLFSTLKSDVAPSAELTRPASSAVKVSRPPTPRSQRPGSLSTSVSASLCAVLSDDGMNSNTLPSSPRSETRDSIGHASPRKLRVVSGEERDPQVETIKASAGVAIPPSMSPRRPPSSPRPSSPQAFAKVSSPRRPTSSRRGCEKADGHRIAEFEEEEIVDGDLDGTMSSMDLLRAKRKERRRNHEDQARRSHQERDEDSQGGRSPSKYTESIAGNSTMSVSSTGSKALGTAKYTPQRSHTLLIKRFMQSAKRTSQNFTINASNEEGGGARTSESKHRQRQ